MVPKRMAATLTRVLGRPINRKKGREYSERYVTLSHLKVREKPYVQRYQL